MRVLRRSDDLDDIVGFFPIFQNNNLVYSAIMRGIIFQDEDEIRELLYPLLDKAEKWALEMLNPKESVRWF